ncbi:unnamed protein product [Brassica oleracea var. botrytis]
MGSHHFHVRMQLVIRLLLHKTSRIGTSHNAYRRFLGAP